MYIYSNQYHRLNTRGATSKHKIGIFAHAYWDCHYFVIDCDLVCVIVIKRKKTLNMSKMVTAKTARVVELFVSTVFSQQITFT